MTYLTTIPSTLYGDPIVKKITQPGDVTINEDCTLYLYEGNLSQYNKFFTITGLSPNSNNNSNISSGNSSAVVFNKGIFPNYTYSIVTRLNKYNIDIGERSDITVSDVKLLSDDYGIYIRFHVYMYLRVISLIESGESSIEIDIHRVSDYNSAANNIFIFGINE